MTVIQIHSYLIFRVNILFAIKIFSNLLDTFQGLFNDMI